MSRRLPSTAPVLPGFTYVRALGSGGFADVFLYEQNLPRRPVAVKVLLAGLVNDDIRRLFRAEADVMAQLGSHPSILTVFQSSVSADGRPYLVMEYCSTNMSQRYRVDPVSVPDALRIGIKIAGAVESAHRAGVLHRDIKPSNILITAYGHPVLSDFGIAATLADATAGALPGGIDAETAIVGLSIPWSAPEVLDGSVSGSIATEVWALGATLYSLLAGRSPWEIPGGDNGPDALIARISKAKSPSTGRDDVPVRLDEILARTMRRRPEQRQHSARELIRELQSVEAEMGLAQTPLEESLDQWAESVPSDPADRTRISAGHSTKDVVVGDGRRRRSSVRAGNSPGRGHTHSRTRESSAIRLHRPRRVGAVVWVFLAAVVLIVGTAAGVTTLLSPESTDIPTVSDVSGREADGRIVFRWPDPGLHSGDTYIVHLRTGEKSIQRGTEFGVDAQGRGMVCATVTVNRNGSTGAPSGEKCVDAAANP